MASYPEGSPDRALSFTSGLERLSAALREEARIDVQGEAAAPPWWWPERMARLGCTVRRIPATEKPPVWELSRVIDGQLLYYAVAIAVDWPLEPSVIRAICRRLRIDPMAEWSVQVIGEASKA